MTLNWQKPNIMPPLTKGYLVIETDDGKRGAYTDWLPLLQKITRSYTKFSNARVVPCCPNVNTGFVMDKNPEYMTSDQIKQLVDIFGWEMVSHGRQHAGMGLWGLTQNASAGDTTLHMQVDGRMKRYDSTGYEYIISEGSKSEIIRKIDGTEQMHTNGTITIDSPLVNSYTTNAKIQLTDESRISDLQGCIDDFAEMGVESVNHHVYTYHDGSGSGGYINNHAMAEVNKLFLSARGGSSSNGVNKKGVANVNNLDALLLNNSTTTTTIDSQLDLCQSNNAVLVVYGHNETKGLNAYNTLEYLVTNAIERGIKIVTRQEAYEILTA